MAFTAPGSDGGATITNYEYSTDNGSTWTARSPVSTASPVVITGLTNGTTYQVKLRAVNSVGGGAASSAVSVTPTAADVPGAPTVGTATAGNGQASVAFTAPISDGGATITNYEYSTDNGGTWTARSPASAASPVVIIGLTNGTTYQVKLRAVNSAGPGAASSAVSVTPAPTAPGAPTIGTATKGNGQATVPFTAPASDGGSAITGYTATSSPGGMTGTCTAPCTSITVTGLTNGTAYTFTVTATNALGTSTPSGTSNSVTPAPTVPGVPTIGTATKGNGQATVPFTAPVSDGGSAITGYTATSSPGGITGTCTLPCTSITVMGLTNGTAYTFTVTATNAVGTSSPSGPSNSVTPSAPTVPGTPTIGTATAGNGQATVPFTVPTSDGGSAITSYTVTSSPGGKTGSCTAPCTSITVTGLANGTAYTFTVTATNAVGTSSPSGTSNSVTPAASVPGACGPANGTAVTSPPASGLLCSGGTASAVSEVSGGRYSWTCAGQNGGSTAMCSAGQGGGVVGPGGGEIQFSLPVAAGCSVSSLALIPPPGNGPSGQVMPYGLVDFKLVGCTGSRVTVQFAFPDSVEGMQLWKYGRYPDLNGAVQWYVMPGVVVSGNTITYSIDDNGLGDSDPAVGVIADPAGPGRPVPGGGGGESAITVVSNPSRAGTVTCNPNPIPAGGSATCTATANSGYTFGRFSDNCVRTTGTSCVIRNVGGPQTVTATFNTYLGNYTLRAVKNGTSFGTVTSSPYGINCGPAPSCVATYAGGNTVTLLATPIAGAVFDGWAGDCSGKGSCTVTLWSDKTATATFTWRGPGSALANEDVQEAYIAYYGRPAEPGGLGYWAVRQDNGGGSLNTIIDAFGRADEYTRRYQNQSNTALVTNLYKQLLGRDPEATGLAWYVNEMNAGRSTLPSIALDVIFGAVNPPDSSVVANKMDVANHYTGKVAKGCAYGSELDGLKSLATVTMDPATVWAAKLAIERRCGM